MSNATIKTPSIEDMIVIYDRERKNYEFSEINILSYIRLLIDIVEPITNIGRKEPTSQPKYMVFE
jgi:hypothetical protein